MGSATDDGEANGRWGNGATRQLTPAVIYALVLSPVLLSAAFGYHRISALLTESTLSQREAVVYLAASLLKEELDRTKDLGVSLATRVRFLKLVEEGRWGEAVRIMDAVPKNFPRVNHVILCDSAGRIKAQTPPAPEASGLSSSDWYSGVVRVGGPYLSGVYRTGEGRDSVLAAAVPLGNEHKTRLGFLVLEVRVDALLDWIARIPNQPKGSLYFIDQHGRLAATTGAAPQAPFDDATGAPVAARALRGERGTMIGPLERGGPDYITAFEPVPDYRWVVVAQQPLAASAGGRSLRVLAALYTVFFLLTLALASVIVKSLVALRAGAAELESRARQLKAANAELEAFSSSVAHDLRAPLRSIHGFSKLLLDQYSGSLDAQGKDYLSRVNGSVAGLGRIIDGLLELARMSRTELRSRPVDLSALACEIAQRLASSEPSRKVSWVIAPDLIVRGDARLLEAALENLLGNAWKFTSLKPSANIEFGLTREEGAAAYFVSDDGAGFDMAHSRKLFEAFSRLHSASEFPGSGIGLATVARILARHGGRIWAKSEVGKGSTFYFTLP